MRPSKDLRVLDRCVGRYLDRLKYLLAAAPYETRQNLSASFSAIELLTLWGNFSRAFYISSALGARTTSGKKITHVNAAITNKDTSLYFAVLAFGRYDRSKGVPPRITHREEPIWYDESLLPRIAADPRMRLSNDSQINAALSSGSGIFDELAVIRNYVAHRNEATRTSVSNVIPFLERKKRQTVNQYLLRPSAGVTVLQQWIRDMKLITSIMCA